MEKLEIDKRNKEIIFNIILPNKKKVINIIICLCYNILNIVNNYYCYGEYSYGIFKWAKLLKA